MRRGGARRMLERHKNCQVDGVLGETFNRKKEKFGKERVSIFAPASLWAGEGKEEIDRALCAGQGSFRRRIEGYKVGGAVVWTIATRDSHTSKKGLGQRRLGVLPR